MPNHKSTVRLPGVVRSCLCVTKTLFILVLCFAPLSVRVELIAPAIRHTWL
jgi:hypothetical protein